MNNTDINNNINDSDNNINNSDNIDKESRTILLKEAIMKYFKQELNEIPLYLYDGIDELNDLDLSKMSIKEIPDKLFGCSIKTFKNINLSYNQLEKIPSNLFKNATELEKISFNNNKIKKLPQHLFAQAKKLKDIRFDANQIEELPPKNF